MKQGDSSVREYNTSFLVGGLLQNHDQETLLKIYRDGLRKDIRWGISSSEFSTIDDIMHAALKVEEGGSSSASKGSPTDSDESSKPPKKKPRTKYKQNEDPEDEHGYDAFESCTPNTEEEGSEDASDSDGDLKDYQEHLQNIHKSSSESSAESD
ncbi:unnamed protein product [Brassica oleracea]|uniref:Uncharacterized protein n=1 Tax=Brassica oleracea TaxID=3712 RepID=A0A3P6C1Q7_BRAOL|nr:unnamed protein product [Brassica oleracea]